MTDARPADRRRALVLFSGGQDSTTCLAWALARFDAVETVGFDYGQRHVVELACRIEVLRQLRTLFPGWAARLGDDHLLELPVLGRIADCALTDDRAIALRADGLPNTFVPGRNLVFLTLAAALAYRRGAAVLVGGMCEADFSGYPDCRQATLTALQSALQRGLDTPLAIDTPLMRLDKAQLWALAHDLGGAALNRLIVESTHTCYLGDRSRHHDWGYGCGECPACMLRRCGFEGWRRAREAVAGGPSA